MPQHNTPLDSASTERQQSQSPNSQIGGTAAVGRPLSVSNVRPKTRIVSGVDLEQPSIDLFESAISDGDLTLARDALLAYREEVDGSIPVAQNDDVQTASSYSTSTQATNSTDSTNSVSDPMDNPSAIAGTTPRIHGRRLEQLISEIEAEVHAEYESNQQESAAAVTRLQLALSHEAEQATALTVRIEELESDFQIQRDNHAAQIEQLTLEYQQQFGSIQEQNQTARFEYIQRIDELRSSRTSTADEIEAAWNSIEDEKSRWQAKQDNESQELEQLTEQLTEEHAALQREQETWHQQTAQARDEMVSLRDEHEQELSRARAEISRERAAWDVIRDRDTSDLGEQLSNQHTDIEKARAELATLNARHDLLKREHSAHIESFEQTFKERADRQRADLEQELIARRAAWGQIEQRERAQIESEKESLRTAVEQLQDLLERRKAQHAAEITRMQIECQRNNEIWSAAERTRIDSEQSDTKKSIAMSQVLLQQQRDEWALARDEEAAILRKQSDAQLEESNRLGVTAAAQEAEQSRIDAQAAQLKSNAEKLAAENAQVRAEIEKERVESERVLHNERQTHFEDLQARQADLVRRQSITEEKIRQQEQEWAERQRQIEHDLNASRMLHQRKLDQLASDWDATAKSKREELEQEEQTLQDVRAELGREKARHQTELDEATRKLASDRHLIQDGLTQMDAQLKWVTNHLGTSQDIIPFQPREAAEPILTASETSNSDANEATDDEKQWDQATVDADAENSTEENNADEDEVDRKAVNAETIAQDIVEPEYDQGEELSIDEADESTADAEAVENFVDPEETLFESESNSRQFGDYGATGPDLVGTDGPELSDDAWESEEFAEAFEPTSDYFTAGASQPEDDEPNVIDQGWVAKIRGTEEPSETVEPSATKPEIPTGGEPEWACVVETAYVRSLAQRQENTADSETEEVVDDASDEVLAENIDDESIDNAKLETADEAIADEDAADTNCETISAEESSDDDASENETAEELAVEASDATELQDATASEIASLDPTAADADDPTNEAADSDPDSQKLLRIDNEGVTEKAAEERRRAIQDYRLKLLDLQAQLGDLNNLAEQNKVDQ